MNQAFNLEDRWIETPFGRLFVRIWSSRNSDRPRQQLAPIVMFHDSLGCVELWRRFPEQLCTMTGRTVIAYDRLGFGPSDPYRDEWGVDFIRREANTYFPRLREQLGLEGFVAFGHSVGGAMAAHCAAAFPSACRALVAESAQAFVEERTVQGILEAKAGFQQEGQLDRLKKYHGDKARWVLEAWTETWLSPEFQSWNMDAALRHVTCPALIIHGEEDEYGSTEHPKRIADTVAGPVTMEILPGCRHVPHREAEAKVLDLVARFVRAVDSGGKP
jgi:pimeloyl-ACP methyl ester carboxylesterase